MNTSEFRQIAESPSQIISRYVGAIEALGKGQVAQYCFEVARQYNAIHAESSRTIAFDLTTGTPDQIIGRVFKRIRRWLDPMDSLHVPADAVRCLIDAMPKEQRGHCWAEVLGAMDHLAVRKKSGDVDYCDSFSELLNVFSGVTKAAAPIIADGRLDEADRPYAPEMLKRIEEMKGILCGWEEAIQQQILGKRPALKVAEQQ